MTDDRLTCRQCRWLNGADECGVAAKRAAMYRSNPVSINGDFPRWRYSPVLDVKRRCEFGERIQIVNSISSMSNAA